ncbi:ribonuclease H-like domain-containing protein [Rhizophagus clarus]|uniref:Ribonuclease H-like domain-containing protein n=1 Tax=Rhizophagus clarus TaxID=94130 RepID=A0A8H3KV64_9GLOM|nr:ribonuclease H-like domain-containing protein [Rhizophagus clarus]
MILGKQNSWNTYAVCLACNENLEENELKNHTFTNKKPQVKNHLKNCIYFREKVGGQEEVDAIINLTDNENEEIARQKRLRTDVDSGKIWKEKVVKYLKSMSMQSNFDTVFFKLTEGEISSIRSFTSTSTAPSKRHFRLIKAGDHNVMGNILVQTPTKKEQPMFERLLLRVTVSNGFPFQWIENQATLDLFEFLNPNLILPGRKPLSTHILKDETDNLDVSLFITSSGEILIWKVSDISSERERMIEIIPKIEDLIKGADELGTKVIAITSDSAAAYSGARRQLRLEYPYIVFLPCFAHQCQLAICDIFKESLTLKTASTKAITAATYFKNGNNSYFIGKLRDIQKELYNKYYSIMVPGETRWNSHYFCFKSLVRSKQALQNLAIQHERPQLTSEANSSTSITNEIYLNDNICKILLDNDW